MLAVFRPIIVSGFPSEIFSSWADKRVWRETVTGALCAGIWRRVTLLFSLIVLA